MSFGKRGVVANDRIEKAVRRETVEDRAAREAWEGPRRQRGEYTRPEPDYEVRKIVIQAVTTYATILTGVAGVAYGIWWAMEPHMLALAGALNVMK